MVVGMQNSQQQPHASPATVLEDATTPCALLPSSSLASSLHINKTDCVNSDEHSSTSDESKELAKMAATIKPDAISVAPSNRVKLKDVNEYLICILCNGYFVDATSIAECLHSFCRSCIILYLGTKNFCPKCEVQINNSKPHLSLKPDKTLQDIVYKLVPGLFHAEMKRRNQFYQDKPDRDLHLHPEYRGITVDRLLYSPQDSICLSLEYYDKSKEKEDWEMVGAHRVTFRTMNVTNGDGDFDGASGSPKKHFVCPAAVRVAHLKKLIVQKYCLNYNDQVELFHRRESLPNDYSLMDIAYIYTWKRNSPLKLYYRINVLTEMLESQEILAPTPAIERKSSQTSVKSIALDGLKDKSDSNVVTDEFMAKLTSPSATIEIPSPAMENDLPKISHIDVKPAHSLLDMTVTVAVTKTTLSVEPKNNKSSVKITTIALTSPTNNKLKVNHCMTITTTTTTVHSAPKVSPKFKSFNVDKKSKSIKSPIPNLTPIYVPEKTQVSPIKSYLTISSILNEPEPKKVPVVKNTRKDRNEEGKKQSSSDLVSAVTTSSSNNTVSTKTTASTVVCTVSTKATTVTTTTKPINSLSSIVKLLTTNVSSTVMKNSEAEIKEVSMSSNANDSKVKLSTSMAQVTTCSGTDKTKNVTTVSSINSTIAATITTTSLSLVSATPTVTVTTSVTSNTITTPVSSITITSTIGTAIVTTSTIATNVKVTSSLSMFTSLPSLITLTPATPIMSSSTYTNATSKQSNSSSYILTNTKIPSSLEISLTQTKESKTTSSPVVSLQKMVQHNFTNNAINGTSKANNFEKNRIPIKRSFTDTDDNSQTKYSNLSISKTSSSDDKKCLIKEKRLNLQNEISMSTSNGAATAKKIFSPNILPEVSITLNPHPERKRMPPETSYDVSCFKPSEKKEISANGVPPLTPISTSVCKNIQNSPIKNLNKNLKMNPRNTFLSKNRSMPLFKTDIEMRGHKRNNMFAESTETAKRVAIENGGLPVRSVGKDFANGSVLSELLFRPQIDSLKSTPSVCKSMGNVKTVKKDTNNGSATKKESGKHQGIPQLIDINTSQYTKMMAQNAKTKLLNYFNNFGWSLYVKPTESAAENALDLSLPSSSKSLTSDKTDTSPCTLLIRRS